MPRRKTKNSFVIRITAKMICLLFTFYCLTPLLSTLDLNECFSFPYFVDAGCTEMVNQGNGQENVLRFFYDKDKEHCFPFFYKGEGGNGNRFFTELECLGNCSARYLDLYPEGGEVFFNHVEFLFLIGRINFLIVHALVLRQCCYSNRFFKEPHLEPHDLWLIINKLKVLRWRSFGKESPMLALY